MYANPFLGGDYRPQNVWLKVPRIKTHHVCFLSASIKHTQIGSTLISEPINTTTL